MLQTFLVVMCIVALVLAAIVIHLVKERIALGKAYTLAKSHFNVAQGVLLTAEDVAGIKELGVWLYERPQYHEKYRCEALLMWSKELAFPPPPRPVRRRVTEDG